MRLIGATTVRNGADIVEAFVRHNLTLLDALAVFDHGSFDGSRFQHPLALVLAFAERVLAKKPRP